MLATHTNQKINTITNVGREYAELEISHWISHADHHLNRIRDLIAEKTFQYSHVICVPPCKAVNTHLRAKVKKINLQISVHCKLYTQCRAQLIKLGASPDQMIHFKVLTVDDIKAGTAIVNPNEPGSNLKLSWIWQSASGHHWGLVPSTGTGPLHSRAGANLNIIECRFLIRIIIIN